MKLPKYNLGYNTWDQLKSAAISANGRKLIEVRSSSLETLMGKGTLGQDMTLFQVSSFSKS